MTKWRNSFPVRASHRMYVNRGKACPVCGQNDPLLLGEDGRCANCASHHKEEGHHIVSKPFQRTKEDRQAVIGVSPNAHRLLSDLQSGHLTPPVDDPDSWSFLEAWLLEIMSAFIELWWILTYLHEPPELSQDLFRVGLFLIGLWLLTRIPHLDFHQLLEHARMKLHENEA